ncbi:MAG: hypothetical protein KKA60_01290 [Proteobacteria bacterium]|nr:hypothetical protein [Pseudomonadota bacterium]
MKQYMVDQLSPGDREKLKNLLDERLGPARLGVYWIPMDPELYNPEQAGHGDCHPLVFALDLEPSFLSCEFLVRSLSRMRCGCMGYADPAQARYIMDFVDRLLVELGIIA